MSGRYTLISLLVFVPLNVLADVFPFGGSSETFGAGILKINNLSSFPNEKFFIDCPRDTERRVYSDTLIVMCEGVGNHGSTIRFRMEGQDENWDIPWVDANTFIELTIDSIIDKKIYWRRNDLPKEFVLRHCPDAEKKSSDNETGFWLTAIAMVAGGLVAISLFRTRRKEKEAK